MSAAVFMRTAEVMRDSMPQTVPSAGLSPLRVPYDYGDFAADAFDLSLLPAPAAAPATLGGYSIASPDCEVPYSPTSAQQLMSLFCDATASPPPMFPSDLKPGEKQPTIKTEPGAGAYLGSCSSWENQTAIFGAAGCEPYIKQEVGAASEYRDDQDASVPQLSDHDDAMRKGSDHQLLREVLKDTSFQRKFNLKPFDLGGLGGLGAAWAPLRRTLSGGGGAGVKMETDAADDLPQLDQDAIEPMISLAIQQMRNDIGNTCSMLGISPDPSQWTPEDVRAWLLWTVRQFSLQPVQLSLFDMEGAALASMSEADLLQRAPQSGSLIFAQLEIWKASCAEDLDALLGCRDAASPPAAPAPAPVLPPLVPQVETPPPRSAPATPLSAPPVEAAASPQSQHSGHPSSASSAADTSDDEDEECEAPSSASSAVGSSGSSRGAHIHLWQFLKELLGSPQMHGACVRWIDRPAGVFKIEDSVRVARLWGARKNRPAMNYDKLSRSIRQYYKKGIMKKTERSQRLVYQFCHPYSL